MKRLTRSRAGGWAIARVIALVLATFSTAGFAETELTLQTGARFGETDRAVPVFGLTADFERAPDRWLSAIWSVQDTEIHRRNTLPGDGVLDLYVHYLEFGGVYRPPANGSASWFVTAGAGAAWIAPRDSSFDDEWSLTLMFGGGAVVPLSERLGLRFDARGHFMLTDIRLSGVCGGVGCSIDFASGGAFQLEGLVGLSIDF